MVSMKYVVLGCAVVLASMLAYGEENSKNKEQKKSSAHSTAAKSKVKSRHFFHASVNLLASVSQLHISLENNNRI